MQALIERKDKARVLEYMQIFPVVAILGPRQCGKSTLAKEIGKGLPNFIYLDLENPSDIKRIDDVSLFFDINSEATICIDEVQYKPDIFPELRSIIDKKRRNGKLLLLGSASRDLINKSAESLAGRIGYIELAPFNVFEVGNVTITELTDHWQRGGFPPSYLANTDRQSYIWRQSYLRSYLERDLIHGSNSLPLLTINRLLQMLANNHGQLVNSSKYGANIGVSHNTIRNYLDFFETSFITRNLKPFSPNQNKRLTKSPKVYIRDSGLLHVLLEIESINQLLGHPVFGQSWEGYVIENLLNLLPKYTPWFYRTATGCEIDLILTRGSNKLGFECKATSAPDISRGTYSAMEDTDIKELFVVAPVQQMYHLKNNVIVGNLVDAIKYASER